MAELTAAQRQEIWAEFMRQNTEPVGITKAQLRAAFDALDAFLDANAAAINAAIPQPARGALSAGQKARILAFVAMKRWGG